MQEMLVAIDHTHKLSCKIAVFMIAAKIPIEYLQRYDKTRNLYCIKSEVDGILDKFVSEFKDCVTVINIK